LQFASKCFTPLEIAHYKDNFKALADHQDDIEYWKEETLCRFLCIPDSLQAGSVVYAMCTYLGAFPFPSLSPAILTREAMLKVITIFTARYRKVLKKGNQDKTKLLFRSLAIFDRRSSMSVGSEKQQTSNTNIENFTEQDIKDLKSAEHEKDSAPSGFAVDMPANDDEEEDDDDLALAALDALDAIEVFKHDQKTDRKISHANIPASNLKRLIELLLTMIWLSAQESLAKYSESLTKSHLSRLDEVSECVVQAFDPDAVSEGISYQSFVNTVLTSVPYLFEPLNPLFERFLFSKNLDLSRYRDAAGQPSMPEPLGRRPQILGKSDEQGILDQASLSQLNIFLDIESSAEFHPLYSTNQDGTSLSSFSRQVLSWQSATILLLKGSTASSKKQVTIGAYLPEHWGNASSTKAPEDAAKKPIMFQLSPRHAVFPGNSLNKSLPVSYFSNDTGMALGCVIPPVSRTHGPVPIPALGPVGLLIDSDIAIAIFQHDGDGGIGAFMTDPRLEAAQRRGLAQHKKMEIDIDVLEVWGINTSDDKGEDEATKQKKRLAWEEAEAARRRGVNFGGDKGGARALLEMAGIVGDNSGNRTGGSV
jgi:predicted DNA binding CopG/RHH family protein